MTTNDTLICMYLNEYLSWRDTSGTKYTCNPRGAPAQIERCRIENAHQLINKTKAPSGAYYKHYISGPSCGANFSFNCSGCWQKKTQRLSSIHTFIMHVKRYRIA